MDYLQADVTGGQMVWSGQFSGPFDPVQSWVNYDQVYWPNSLPAVSLQGRTLEIRVDLIHADADDVILSFGAGGRSVGGRDSWYYISMDQNEIGLSKGEYGVGETVCFYTAAAITNRDATVSLAFTLTGDTLRLTTRVLAASTGEVLFQRSFEDGPGSDCPVPVPPPKGMPGYRADWGAPLTNLTYVWAGVSDTRTTLPGPPALEVVLDNLEYDLYEAPLLQIAKSVLLSWPADTLEEQIVVGADAIEGPWRPWPAPIYQQSGRWCMAAPITTAQQWTQPAQYFKLVPGTQSSDDFDPPRWPYTRKGDWVPGFYDPAGATQWSITASAGALRVRTLGTLQSQYLALRPPGPGVSVKDFWMSVDIVDLAATHQGAGIALVARLMTDFSEYPRGATNGYLANLWPNWSGPNQAALTLYDYEAQSAPSAGFEFKPGTPYRFIFSGVGTRLSLELIDLESGQRKAELVVTDNSAQASSQGFVGLFLSTGANPSPCDLTIDNFFVTGTR